MQNLNIRYALFLMPLIYILIPFILSGTFLILGGVTLASVIIGLLVFIVLSNLNIGGGAEAVTVGGRFNFSLNNEGSYSLFVVFVGGIFYLGTQLVTFLTPILNLFVWLLNTVIGAISFLSGSDTTSLQTNIINNLSGESATNLSNVYPLWIQVQGISVFLTLDAIFASMFILSLYFMISSRGQ